LTKNSSKTEKIDNIYSAIANIAEQGDLVFFTTHYFYKPEENTAIGSFRHRIRLWLWPWLKSCLGFDKNDFDDWHVAVYLMHRKRPRNRRINHWIVHSTAEKGVHMEQLSPNSFINALNDRMKRIEILRFEGITDIHKKKITDSACSKLGLKFDKSTWGQTLLPYVFGVPNIFYRQDEFSCQQLVIAAYAAAGIYFSHPFEFFPIFNFGRFLGRPLGHPRGKVNPRFPYLMDHHIYRDPRFFIKAIIYQEPETGEIRFEKENLQKYSWDDSLRKKYKKWSEIY
jgi:hypothetical protein